MNRARRSRLLTVMPTFRRALLAACLLLPSALSVSGAAACEHTPSADGWARIRPSGFAVGEDVITGLAMQPRRPDQIFVTNGIAVLATDDGGCSWRDVVLPASALPAQIAGGQSVVEIETASERTGAEALWVLAQAHGTLPRPLAYLSTDGGVSFAAPGYGLPPAGEAQSIASAADGRTAYVVVQLPSVGRRLYVTVDGGARWNAAAPAGEFPYLTLVVDTDEPEHVFGWGTDVLAESYDAGATWTTVSLPAAGVIRDVALTQAARGSRLSVLAENGTLLRSDNDGNDWTPREVSPRVDQVAAAPDVDVAAVAGDGVVTLLPSIFREIDASPIAAEPLDLSLGVTRTGEVRLAGRSGADVVFFVGAAVRVPGAVDVRGARLVLPLGPRVVPERAELTLAPGEVRELDYELDVPATPSPIEVFFLIDTTGSMQFVIDGVREGLAKIVNDLADAGIPARFGVGEVKEYPFSPYSGGSDLPYRLLRKVGPVNDELESALGELRAGGGGDGPEAMTAGFYQLSTGKGDVVGTRTMVPPGDDAGFGDAMRIVIASTDARYNRGAAYPGPTVETAHAALNGERIQVIGIAAGADAVPDLTRTAAETRTFAPRHGVDCDRDGRVDVQEGTPLVCRILGGAAVNVTGGGIKVDTSGVRGVGSAVITLLRNLRDPSTLALASSAPDVARVVGAPVRVDLKTPHAVPYRVRVACPPERYGSTSRVELTGQVGARPVATATLAVRCLAPMLPLAAPRAEAPPEIPPQHARPLAAAAAAPPAPVQPVQQVNPNTNPQPNPNPNAQLQAGAAQQRQEQFQVALAHGSAGQVETRDELAFVRRDPPAALVPLAAALLTATAAGAVAWRMRTAPVPAVARRRRPC